MTTLSDPEEGPAIKRAEQNRAAQRAFRQRKQQYIKWLESKAEELDEVYKIMALVRTENQILCKLVMDLDERINTNHGDGDAKTLQTSSLLPPSSILAGGSVSGLSNSEEGGRIRFDTALGREVSARLMSLASFPGSELSGERHSALLDRPKYQPRNSNYEHKAGLKIRAPRSASLPQPALPPTQTIHCLSTIDSATGSTTTATSSSTYTEVASVENGHSLQIAEAVMETPLTGYALSPQHEFETSKAY